LKTSTFKQKQKHTNLFWLFCFVVFGFGFLQAQVQNNGTLYIKDGSYVYINTGAFTFGTGSATSTSRTANTFGKLIFGAAATSSGAASGASLFTDGFASTRSTSYFELPTGQSTTYAPVGITNATVTNGVDAAYYVGPLANGSSLASTLAALPTAGYWDIKGDNATITMIWSSDISTLTASIANLTVAGLNGTTWEAIPSGTPTGSLTSGTIATSAAVNLANYSAFTLARKGISCAEITASSGTTRTWNGTGWDTAPTLEDAVTFTGNYPSTAGSFVCNSLAIGTFNIALADGQTIEVVNGISGTGVITMSSAASILQRNDASSISPTIALTKSTRTGMYAYDYMYWGSPLTSNSFDQLAAATAYNNANTTATGVAGAFDLMYKYVSGTTSASGGWQAFTATTPGNGFITRIKLQAPFATASTQNTTDHINVTFTGTANNGTVNVDIANVVGNATSARNNNLLSNPYPSAIDADKFLEYNTNIDGVVYVWKAQTTNNGVGGSAYAPADYIAYTRAGSTKYGTVGTVAFDGKIATGQGFKVKAITTTGTGTATFNNCMRISGNNTNFMRTNSNPIVDRYKLNLIGLNGVGSQILVAYSPETTLAYDRMYDAEVLSVSGTQLYSILDNDTKKLTINARPTFETADVVNLGISKTGSATESYTVAIAEKEGVFATTAVTVYLHDTQLNVYHNLANGAYTFNSNTSELNNRFQVVYQNGALGNIDFESNNVFATINNESLKIVASLPITNVTIYDISGRLVTDFKVDNQVEVSSAFRYAEGIYIAKIKMNNGVIATQKLINKK
jgi:hypothetical protein